MFEAKEMKNCYSYLSQSLEIHSRNLSALFSENLVAKISGAFLRALQNFFLHRMNWKSLVQKMLSFEKMRHFEREEQKGFKWPDCDRQVKTIQISWPASKCQKFHFWFCFWLLEFLAWIQAKSKIKIVFYAHFVLEPLKMDFKVKFWRPWTLTKESWKCAKNTRPNVSIDNIQSCKN